MIGSALSLLARTILYEWLVSLWELLKLLFRRPPARKGDREHRPTTTGCVRIDHPAFVRPDPLLYSQRALIAKGLAVTYDNPDITLFKGGIPVNSSELEPATTYEVRVRVWNNSLVAPAIQLPVHLSYLDFGVGTQSIPIGSVRIDVGVKGSPDQPGFATLSWTTPAAPGHYCLQALLEPVDDVDFLNNLGQENTDVVAAHSPAIFKFTLRNNTPRPHRYRFEVDSYQIPALPKCKDVKPARDKNLAIHRRQQHPVPKGFAVKIEPTTPSLDPGASVPVTVIVEPPTGFRGSQPINVNAFHELGYAGGVTLTCVKGA